MTADTDSQGHTVYERRMELPPSLTTTDYRTEDDAESRNHGRQIAARPTYPAAHTSSDTPTSGNAWA